MTFFLKFRNFSPRWAKCFPVFFRHEEKKNPKTSGVKARHVLHRKLHFLSDTSNTCLLSGWEKSHSQLSLLIECCWWRLSLSPHLHPHFIPVSQTFSLKLIECAGSLFCCIWTSPHMTLYLCSAAPGVSRAADDHFRQSCKGFGVSQCKGTHEETSGLSGSWKNSSPACVLGEKGLWWLRSPLEGWSGAALRSLLAPLGSWGLVP